jgi:hypothetical protein
MNIFPEFFAKKPSFCLDVIMLIHSQKSHLLKEKLFSRPTFCVQKYISKNIVIIRHFDVWQCRQSFILQNLLEMFE